MVYRCTIAVGSAGPGRFESQEGLAHHQVEIVDVVPTGDWTRFSSLPSVL